MNSDIRSFILLIVVCFLMFQCGYVEADSEVPIKCEKQRAKVKVIEQQFADKIFMLWVKQGSRVEPEKLYNQARFTAWYILKDNNIVCRSFK